MTHDAMDAVKADGRIAQQANEFSVLALALRAEGLHAVLRYGAGDTTLY